MPGSLPESYRRLVAFSCRLAAGTLLYEQGAVPDSFYVVLAGDVLFEVVSEHGETETVAFARPGDLVGHVAAFTGRPTSASARVDHEAAMLAIPVARVTEAIREAPELGLQLIRAFAGVDSPSLTVEGDAAGTATDETASLPASPTPPAGVVGVAGDVDPAVFFTDTVTCPVSQTKFEFLRVRTRVVRPADRDSDFRVRYHGIDPTRYGVVVCPTCGFASYLDDFDTLDDIARTRLWEDREGRVALVGTGLNRVRSDEDAVTVLDLAMRCYDLRGANASRRAVLEHRRAWLERDANNQAAERTWLVRARESYQSAYEHDTRISDEAAARVAYIVGDISMRLGEAHEAAQWLETAVRIAPKERAGIVRAARDRLQDVRQLLKQERMAS